VTSPAPIEDPFVREMNGLEIQSETANATYRLLHRVGEGGMGVAFYALRIAPDGECPVVVKILRPEFVRQWGDTAKLIVQKEAVALGRLNERVPSTPFVVRFIDTGALSHRDALGAVDLPYIVVEYVHGGRDGTTLTERVRHCVKRKGVAFDAVRVGRLIEALGQGLVAVHDVGVIHRDLKPDNVLCCGHGEEEIFKIADFGVARPAGVAATFGGFVVGTMGYAAPELATLDQTVIGSWSDVFSLAAVIYFALTGELYFDVTTPGEAIVAATDPKRPSIRDMKALSPDLRVDEHACRAIDFALACATSAKTEVRPNRADALATMILPWLRSVAPRSSISVPVTHGLSDYDDATAIVDWRWTVLRQPGALGGVVRDVAWDSDGRCMAATTQGLAYWNGATWREVDHTGLPNPEAIRFVQRAGPGQWLVGGDEATFATYTSDGVRDVRRFEGWDVRFELLSGDIDDLAVLVGKGTGEPPTLCALSNRRWLKPLPLSGVANLMSMVRLEDSRWLLVGRDHDGLGFVGVYSPLDWAVETVQSLADRDPVSSSEGPRSIRGQPVRAFLACAAQWERSVGIATGTGGAVVWVRDGEVSYECIPGGPDLAAAAVDEAGRGWAASAGTIWSHTLTHGSSGTRKASGRWEAIWRDPGWKAPFVALFVEPGVLIGMTADGGIIEGRALPVDSQAGYNGLVPTVIESG